MSSPRRGVVILAGAFVTACMPAATPQTSATIERYLTCEECVNGELAAVTALGQAAVPALTAALKGPSAQSLANITKSSVDAFSRASAQSNRYSQADRALRPMADSATFVSRNVESFRGLYQARAAHALAVIDPAGSKAIFLAKLSEDSLANPRFFRADIRAMVDSMARTPP
ncbi:MAG: hypothetical protein ABI625_08265 [bacterium]